MTIIVFLIDTSASMNQRTYIGPSFLDLAKGAVDTFLKFRARDPAARGLDRYMLMTFDESPKNVKAGWRENQMFFMQQLKELKATGVTTIGNALGNAFHYLNVNRLQSGIDNFGAGRFPHWLEPAAIILITDGGCMSYPNGTVRQVVEITPSQLPGSELVSEPFRWDQRVFSLVLRLAGHPPKTGIVTGLIPQDTSPIDAICDATGGRSYSITTQKMINQCLESLVQKIQSGVVVCFEKHGPDPPPAGITGEDRSKTIQLENGFIHQNPKATNNHIMGTHVTEQMDVNSTPNAMETSPGSHPSSPSPPPPEPAWARTRRMICVARGLGSRNYVTSHWTIPEAFLPEHSMTTLPPRSAHPVIKFKCEPQEPVFPQDLPFDKYELEPSPLTQFILERKQPNVCWYCYVAGSNGKPSELGAPFAYLKASSAMNSVTLTVLPYNFPALLPLFEEIKAAKGKATPQWRSRFDKYLRGVPPYYIGALKSAFQKITLGHLLNEFPEKYLSVNVQANLGKVKLRAKEEFERQCQTIAQGIPVVQEGVRVIPRSSFASLLASNKLFGEGMQQLKIDASEFNGFRIHVAPNGNAALSRMTPMPGQSQMSFRNPFDIQRDQLLVQIAKMRVNLKQSLCNGSAPQLVGAKPGMKYRLQDVEELHQLPIGVMGNYQDYLRAMTPPLRELDATPARLHAFGNPFKVDKRMLVDEADIDNLVGSAVTAATGQAAPSGGRSHSRKAAAASNSGADGPSAGRHHAISQVQTAQTRKRKPGPLPKDFRYSRKRRRGEDGWSTDDDRSSITGPLSPALSDNSFVSDTSEANDDLASMTSSRASTPGLEEAESGSESLIIEEPSPIPKPKIPEMTNANKTAQDDQVPSTSTASDVVGLLRLKKGSAPSTAAKRSACGSGENGAGAGRKKVKKKATKAVAVAKVTVDEWTVLKKEISAMIRKPAQDYKSLLEKIDRLPRSVDHGLYSWALSEAERFRRIGLCEQLRKRISDMKKPNHSKNSKKQGSRAKR